MLRLISFALAGVLGLAACGGGGDGGFAPSDDGSGPPIATAAPNVQPITIDAGVGSIPEVNTLFTTVTVCVPDTSTCQTIDHILVDTGSSGLRILSSALPFTLPQQIDNNNDPIVECVGFVDGVSWGPLKVADIQISGELATSSSVQVIGDNAYATVPAACSSMGGLEDTVDAFGAKGVLGVGAFVADCGSTCATVVDNGTYYSCPTSTTCQPIALSVGEQVSNPVALFTTDNNGVIIQLPSIPTSGASAVTGALVFGIDTQSNNGLGNATILTIDSDAGDFTTVYKGASMPNSFFDSGSNAYAFDDSSISGCSSSSGLSGFLCPNGTLNLSATLQGVSGGTGTTVNFSVGNASDLLNSASVVALKNLGASGNGAQNSFDWGLPFFFGREVFTAIEQRNTSGGVGPYVAF